MTTTDRAELMRELSRRAARPVLPLGRRAREAARAAQRRAQYLATQGAIKVQKTVRQQAERFRWSGALAAVHDMNLLEMAKMPERMKQRAAVSVLERDQIPERHQGTLPDPAWVDGYRKVVTGRLPGLFPEAAPAQPADKDGPELEAS
jgi:hypothetical protein